MKPFLDTEAIDARRGEERKRDIDPATLAFWVLTLGLFGYVGAAIGGGTPDGAWLGQLFLGAAFVPWLWLLGRHLEALWVLAWAGRNPGEMDGRLLLSGKFCGARFYRVAIVDGVLVMLLGLLTFSLFLASGGPCIVLLGPKLRDRSQHRRLPRQNLPDC